MIGVEKRFAVLPTMLTLGNAFCGFAAITYAAKLGPAEVSSGGAHLRIAALYIFAGMLFDMLDGRVARWANQQSEFGAQLDSLCDVVTFGVAPAFLLRQFSAQSVFHPRILWVIASLYLVCAILRLARFTTDTDEEDSHEGFDGLPSPAAAGVIAAFPIAMNVVLRWLDPSNLRVSEWARGLSAWLNMALVQSLPIFTLAVACLMISQLPYSHVFNRFFTGRRPRRYLIYIVFAVAVALLVGELAVLIVFLWFAFSSPLAAFADWLQRRVMTPQQRD